MNRLIAMRSAVLMLLVALGLAACGPAPVAQGINDPYEEQNRAVHRFNVALDKRIVKPLSSNFSGGEPSQVQRSIGNFASNMSLPGSVVNDLLQANIEDAAHNAVRFLFNSTFGILGLFDPMTSAGLEARPSDFGETLHVWGFEEGHYVELPFKGPSTKRDAIGSFVDLFTNPLSYILPKPERYAGPLAGAVSKVGDRGRFSGTIDSVLYESADSYEQARLLYLESRRFQLGGGTAEDAYDDYEEFYAD